MKKGLIYLPVDVRERLGIKDNEELLLEIEDERIILRPLKTIFRLGIESRKVSKASVEEFERESEEMQRKLYGE